MSREGAIRPETMEHSMNRIVFANNPWPNGHAIKELVWSARLEPREGVWFDLHLVSDDYYAEDELEAGGVCIYDDDDEDEIEIGDDWDSKIVWRNFHSCILSSTYWGREGDWGHKGFLAATREDPLDFANISKRTFRVDRLPYPTSPSGRAFGIYLLGHDGVADHRIRFAPVTGCDDFTLNWQGKIALEYVGSKVFRHRFDARFDHLIFSGIQFPAGTVRKTALSLLEPFVSSIAAFELSKKDDSLWAVLH